MELAKISREATRAATALAPAVLIVIGLITAATSPALVPCLFGVGGACMAGLQLAIRTNLEEVVDIRDNSTVDNLSLVPTHTS